MFTLDYTIDGNLHKTETHATERSLVTALADSGFPFKHIVTHTEDGTVVENYLLVRWAIRYLAS